MSIDNVFLGTGWSFPPTFGESGATLHMVSSETDISQSIEIIFSTYTGERLMHPHFGCDINRYTFGEISHGLLANIKSTITNALLYHEPRIKVDRIDISESDTEEGLLLISLYYTIKNTNTRYNMVYPYYINEAISSNF